MINLWNVVYAKRFILSGNLKSRLRQHKKARRQMPAGFKTIPNLVYYLVEISFDQGFRQVFIHHGDFIAAPYYNVIVYYGESDTAPVIVFNSDHELSGPVEGSKFLGPDMAVNLIDGQIGVFVIGFVQHEAIQRIGYSVWTHDNKGLLERDVEINNEPTYYFSSEFLLGETGYATNGYYVTIFRIN